MFQHGPRPFSVRNERAAKCTHHSRRPAPAQWRLAFHQTSCSSVTAARQWRVGESPGADLLQTCRSAGRRREMGGHHQSPGDRSLSLATIPPVSGTSSRSPCQFQESTASASLAASPPSLPSLPPPPPLPPPRPSPLSPCSLVSHRLLKLQSAS